MIIVTGDRGFIGSELKQYLVNQGYEVHGLDWATRGNTYQPCRMDISYGCNQ